MQKVGGKVVDKLVLKSGDFITTVQQKLIDSTLSLEQMGTTADIAPVTSSAMHRKLTINNDNNLLFQSWYQNFHIHMVLVVVKVINCPFITCFWTALFWKYFVSCWCLPNSSKELELCNNISKKKRLAKCLEIKCIATGCNFL